AAPPIEREPPGDPHQPGAEALAIAQLREAAIRLDERFLRDVLGVLPLAQDAIGDAECERRRFHQPGLEFLLEGAIHGYDASDAVTGVPIHCVYSRQDAALRRTVQWLQYAA